MRQPLSSPNEAPLRATMEYETMGRYMARQLGVDVGVFNTRKLKKANHYNSNFKRSNGARDLLGRDKREKISDRQGSRHNDGGTSL